MKKYFFLIITSFIIIANAFSQKVELRFSGGYGFAKGAAPLSDYDKTYSSSGSQSTVSISNTNDKYTSLGQGIRFEGGMIYYLEEHIGIFIQSGYSNGNENAKMTYTSSFYDYADIKSAHFRCISALAEIGRASCRERV